MSRVTKGLGRVYLPDERDNKFMLRKMLPRKQPKRHYKYYWSSGWRGDQGYTPQCVAYAWIHWLENGSVTQNHLPAPVIPPRTLYNLCQKNDMWPGENYDGTSVRAGAKVLMDMGYISSYRWTWDIDELAMAVLTLGPVVLGTNWYDGMFYPDENHQIHLTGGIAGGHAYWINGVNMEKRMFRLLNSWGDEWGRKGMAWISFDDVSRLLREHGEACLAEEIKKV